MKHYIFAKDIKDKNVEDTIKNDVLVISWEYAYNGVVLELSYSGIGTEKDLYKKFVKYIDQAVDDGALPVQLSAFNWYHWMSIENNATPRQYCVISCPDGHKTLFWKSTFVPGFFA